jgi:cullin 1
MEVFKEWHKANYQKHHLTWVHSLGNATVRATYGKKFYDLQVTTLQAVVLAEFDYGQTFSFTELKYKLNLDNITLKPIMHSLSCGKQKVITKSPSGNKITSTDTFSPNAKFTCNTRKIHIPVASVELSHNKTASRRIGPLRLWLPLWVS